MAVNNKIPILILLINFYGFTGCISSNKSEPKEGQVIYPSPTVTLLKIQGVVGEDYIPSVKIGTGFYIGDQLIVGVDSHAVLSYEQSCSGDKVTINVSDWYKFD
jgi:hypothetical protein